MGTSFILGWENKDTRRRNKPGHIHKEHNKPGCDANSEFNIWNQDDNYKDLSVVTKSPLDKRHRGMMSRGTKWPNSAKTLGTLSSHTWSHRENMKYTENMIKTHIYIWSSSVQFGQGKQLKVVMNTANRVPQLWHIEEINGLPDMTYTHFCNASFSRKLHNKSSHEISKCHGLPMYIS